MTLNWIDLLDLLPSPGEEVLLRLRSYNEDGSVLGTQTIAGAIVEDGNRKYKIKSEVIDLKSNDEQVVDLIEWFLARDYMLEEWASME